MSGYLIAEEGPLAGTTLPLPEEKPSGQWILGRDPDLCDMLLEDPMVSRKHAIVSLTPEGYIFENLSSVNPATQNGKVIAEPVLLSEGDILQIGSTFFRFTEIAPPEEEAVEAPEEEEEAIAAPPPQMETFFGPPPETRWILKVVTGPNAGAEFAMRKGTTYIIGKDPSTCDIIFQDLSVSRQHAKLSVDEDENVFIEDLGSRNGVIVNGELISDRQLLTSQDLVALGTTTFLVVDRKQARETILSPSLVTTSQPTAQAAKEEPSLLIKEKKNWKDLVIPSRHLLMAGLFASVILICLVAMFSLFKSETIVVKQVDETAEIAQLLTRFPAVQFNFNPSTGKLFLVGHVLSSVERQEMLYLLKTVPLIEDVEDNVIVDELVWKNMNDLLSTNPNWVGVSVYGPQPGKFVLRGYLQTQDQQTALSDYINLNFPYLDKLDNQVVVEKNLQTEIQTLLAEKNYAGVTFELSNGEVVFTGRIEEQRNRHFQELLKELRRAPGIRVVKNYVVVTTEDTSQIDLSTQYQVTGYSKRDEKDFFIVINGRILGQGDLLDGMMITRVEPKSVLLEKDGLKYKINYNLQ